MGRWREGWQPSDEPFGGRPSEHPARHAAIVQGRQRAPWMRRGWVRVRVRVRRLTEWARRATWVHVREASGDGGCTACATARRQRPWLCLDGCRAASYRGRVVVQAYGVEPGSAPASQGTALTTTQRSGAPARAPMPTAGCCGRCEAGRARLLDGGQRMVRECWWSTRREAADSAISRLEQSEVAPV
jgi:hypothetical protein